MNYTLPTSVEIDGTSYEIRTDFRVIFDICSVLDDRELSDYEKKVCIVEMFYPDLQGKYPAIEDLVERCFWFIRCGDPVDKQKKPKLVDWEQDFTYITSAVNRVLGADIRGIPYDAEHNTGGLHWWTFISAYNEIGSECTFAQIVRIRDKKARGKNLDKEDTEWYRKNQELVDFRKVYSDAEKDFLKQWGAG